MTDARAVVVLWFVLVVVAMGLEAVHSARNERALRTRGATEPADDVIGTMTWAYPLSFLAMAAEGWWRDRLDVTGVFIGAAIFVLAKAVKYAAIMSLGDRWSFRVLVLPGAPLVHHGPYRVLRHPNYVGVMGELLGTAIGVWSPVSGVAALVGFGAILRRRIAVEERALGLVGTRERTVFRAEDHER